MPSGCSECPKCHQQTLQPYPSRGRAYCLRVADCGYAEDLAPSKDDQIAALVEALNKALDEWHQEGPPSRGSCGDEVCEELEAVLADLPAAARERAEERERLRKALKPFAEVYGRRSKLVRGTRGMSQVAKGHRVGLISEQSDGHFGYLPISAFRDAALAGEKANR